MQLNTRTYSIELPYPAIMGVLNVTPDSFSDGGQFFDIDAAKHHAQKMQIHGADIIDIGGESTRPGAKKISINEELERIIPVIEAVRAEVDLPISIDTRNAAVMRAGVAAGASLINDVNALQNDGALEAVAELNVPVCLMHMKGVPSSMQQQPCYTDVLSEVKDFLKTRAETAVEAGIRAKNIIIDPGFGFGKTLLHNLTLLKHMDSICQLSFPVLVGISRKTMIGQILNLDSPKERGNGSLAAHLYALQHGAHIIRTHDIQITKEALMVWGSINVLSK